MLICPACGEENPPRFRLCGFCGTPLREPAAPVEVRKTVTILFSDVAGFDRARRAARPRVAARGDGPLLRRHAGGHRAPRRHGREVHRRCGHGRVRPAAGARGRRAAGRARGARHARGARRAERRARARLRRDDGQPHRREHRRGRHRRGRRQPAARDRRRGERGRPAGAGGAGDGDAARRAHARARARRRLRPSRSSRSS